MARALFVFSMLLFGCTNESPIHKYYSENETAFELVCDCYVNAGYVSRESCVSSSEFALNATQLDCLDQVYSTNSAAADPTLTCSLQALTEFMDCIRAVDSCDPSAEQACAADLGSAQASCPSLPDSVSASFESCIASGADSDHDGILDAMDACPDQAEDLEGIDDGDGCPESGTYSACSVTTDCAVVPGDSCESETVDAAGTTGSFCTRGCTADSDCASGNGFSGGCYSAEGGAMLCHQRCSTDADCYSGSVCVTLELTTGGEDFICLPDNG